MPAIGLRSKSSDVLTVHLETRSFVHGHGVSLVRRLFEHRGEAKELAVPWLIHRYLLIVSVHGRHPHTPRHHHVGLFAGIAHLVNALPRRKPPDLDLRSQHGRLLVIKQRK
jgi:hypothetical protein